MQIKFLGTGTSHGVPLIGCKCKTCTSDNHKNYRTRSSLFIRNQNTSIIIDTAQEFRLQLLHNNINKVDAIFYTHPHADHLLGFDDIRSINRTTGKIIPCYGNEFTIEEIRRVFPYIFDAVQKGGGLPEVSFHLIKKRIIYKDFSIIPLPVKHGKLDILGYKINNIAYITDCSFIPEKTCEFLNDIDLLILGVLRYREHNTHMNIEQAINLINKIGVNRAYFTHLSHELEYNETNRNLPDHINLAYDGMIIDI
ncbi:MAG: MBL fold metallo-hydrolase [bacterium]